MRLKHRSSVVLPQPDGPISDGDDARCHVERHVLQRLERAVPEIQIPGVDGKAVDLSVPSWVQSAISQNLRSRSVR